MINVHELLRRYDLRPRKGLGQNFLVDPVHLERIVQAAELTSGDMVLEIGPGPGGLTALLAREAGLVVAVELDERMIQVLRDALGGMPNVRIVQGDILELDPAMLVAAEGQPTPEYKVVANLPYYITSAAIRHLLEASHPPSLLVLTVQREVAQRIVAQPPQMSLLAVSVQLYAEAEIVDRIPAGAFYPPPKVESAVVRLRRRLEPAVPVDDREHFFEVVRAGFGQRRKQLRNALAAGLNLPTAMVTQAMSKAGIDPRRRAETMTLAEWARLASVIRGIEREGR